MDHAAAEDFEPVLALAEADFPARTAALDVDLERGRGEGEKARAEAHADVRHFEERLAEFLQHPFQVGERRAVVDDEALDLVEHRRMRLVGVAPIGAAGADDPDRRLLREHRAHLHRARVGAQDLALAMRAGGEKERVVHLARRVAGREVELGEIIVVALDVRPFGDRKAHVGENRDDLVHDLADRMDAAGLDARQADRQGHIDRLALELRLEGGVLQHRAPRRERLRDLILQRVDGRAMRLALVGLELAERGEQRRNRSLLAERGDPHGFERAFVARGVDRGERLPFEGGEVGHGGPILSQAPPIPFSRPWGRRRRQRASAHARPSTGHGAG